MTSSFRSRNRTSDPLDDLSPAGPGRRQGGIQWPQLIVALLLVALFALLAALWQSSTTQRRAVLVASEDLAAGEIFDPSQHARVANVGSDSNIEDRLIPAAAAPGLQGTVLRIGVPANTPLTEGMFQTTSELGPFDALVGFQLEVDELPVTIGFGDVVNIVRTDEPEEIASDAQVVVLRPADNGQTLVVLRMSRAEAPEVQGLAATGDIALVEVQFPESGLAEPLSSGDDGAVDDADAGGN